VESIIDAHEAASPVDIGPLPLSIAHKLDRPQCERIDPLNRHTASRALPITSGSVRYLDVRSMGSVDTRNAGALARLCKPMLQYGGATYNPYLWAMFCVSERRRVAENASDANSERGTQQCSLESAAAALGYFCRSY